MMDRNPHRYGPEATALLDAADIWYQVRSLHETRTPIPDSLRQRRDRVRDGLIPFLRQHNIELRPPRSNPHEPYVCRLGRGLRAYGKDTYANFVEWATRRPDGGAGVARQFDDWTHGRTTLENLPQEIRDFAVITHFSELARGYEDQVLSFDRQMSLLKDMPPDEARETWHEVLDEEATWFWPAWRQVNADRRADWFSPASELSDPDSDFPAMHDSDLDMSDGPSHWSTPAPPHRPGGEHGPARRQNDFGGLRDQAPPTRQRTGRFEADRQGPDGHGLLSGWITQIEYDQRRFQLPDGTWVRDFEIGLALLPAPGIAHEDITNLRQRLVNSVNDNLNNRYTLPGDDKFNVTLNFDHPHPHGSVTVHGDRGTNQTNFSVHAPGGVLAHEILHYLGLPEGYPDDNALLGRQLDLHGPMGPNAARGGWALSPEQLAKIDEIANHGPVRDLPRAQRASIQDSGADRQSQPTEPSRQPTTHRPTPAPSADAARHTPTTAHLGTPFFATNMEEHGSYREGVERRFHTATTDQDAPRDGRPRRVISDEQALMYQHIQEDVIRVELAHPGHFPLYHAQDPRIRIAQDIYKRVHARYHGLDRVPEDFHFLRFPGPRDNEFGRYENVGQFFREDMREHGLIDDNITPTKTHVISANLSLHGGMGHAGEETFHYFQIGQGQTALPVDQFIAAFLAAYGLDASGAREIYERASRFNNTPEGSLLQILVPNEDVDHVAYLAHPHGLPHDDDLLRDLHFLGPIRYDRPAPSVGTADTTPGPDPTAAENPGQEKVNPAEYEREKMNDEITRLLAEIREVWPHEVPFPPATPPPGLLPHGQNTKEDVERARATPEFQRWAKQHQDARLRQEVEDLHRRTLERFDAGHYAPSTLLDTAANSPTSLAHPEFEEQRGRIERNPDHFGGQGIRSRQELMRIANRHNFVQARVLLSTSHMLNPAGGIKIIRHTTVPAGDLTEYRQLLDDYVAGLFAGRDRQPS